MSGETRRRLVGVDGVLDEWPVGTVGKFAKYRVLEVQIFNWIMESRYAFAELRWKVEERNSDCKIEFCTANINSIDGE